MDKNAHREVKIVKLKLDVVFKRLFADKKNEHVLRRFISDILDIPYDEIKSIVVENPELPPDFFNDKFCRLDVRLTVNDTVINIEIQINNEGFYNDRALFYWSKLFTGELKSGDEYSDLKKSVCINIVNFRLFDWDDYHSEFTMLEKTHHESLSDKCSIHFFELNKINKKSPSNDRKELWMQLINAESEEELDMLQKTNVAEIKDTIFIIKNMSDDERIREEARMREKTLHDKATALSFARAAGKAEGKAEGKVEGKAEGKIEGRNDLLAQMRADGVDESILKKYAAM